MDEQDRRIGEDEPVGMDIEIRAARQFGEAIGDRRRLANSKLPPYDVGRSKIDVAGEE